MTVIETLKQAIDRMTSDRDSASNIVRELAAKIGALDANIGAHYAHIGRMHCETLDAAG
jgi:hypothetical protein